MKSKDFGLIVIAVIIGAIFSVIITKFIFDKSNNGQQVEVVPTISGSFPTADTSYFNSSAIDPTQFISIGNSQNSNPFNTNQ